MKSSICLFIFSLLISTLATGETCQYEIVHGIKSSTLPKGFYLASPKSIKLFIVTDNDEKVELNCAHHRTSSRNMFGGYYRDYKCNKDARISPDIMVGYFDFHEPGFEVQYNTVGVFEGVRNSDPIICQKK